MAIKVIGVMRVPKAIKAMTEIWVLQDLQAV
jgi:hypothetical protein